MKHGTQTKIALLRGINVGGHRKILMNDLKLLFQGLGFINVITYIQSGNVIFRCELDSNNSFLESLIAKTIKEKYGFEVPVIIIDDSELREAITQNPFLECNKININHLSLTFLQKSPSEKNRIAIELNSFSPDEFKVGNRWVYIYCTGPFHKTKLSLQFFEKNLETSATSRNWKTVLKLQELSQDLYE